MVCNKKLYVAVSRSWSDQVYGNGYSSNGTDSSENVLWQTAFQLFGGPRPFCLKGSCKVFIFYCSQQLRLLQNACEVL